MKWIYNFRETDTAENPPDLQNRAFQYGDGIFETLLFSKGKICYLADHWERLSAGCAALKIRLPDGLSPDYLSETVTKLTAGESGAFRIRLQVWRQPGGFYTPQSHDADFYLSVQPFEKAAVVIKQKAVFLEQPRLHFSSFSQFKTCNSLPYILASIARQELQADEVMLTDYRNFIAECSASNIFWMQGDVLCTPALETGCIAGIMRKQVLQKARSLGIQTNEGLFTPQHLLEMAETVFTTNVTGIFPIGQVAEKVLDVSHFPDWLRSF